MQRLRLSITNHHEKPEATATKDLPNVHFLSVGVESTLLIKQIFDSLGAGQDNERLGAQNETINRPILVCPLTELKMSILRGHLILSATVFV
jgi:hypothetical protein